MPPNRPDQSDGEAEGGATTPSREVARARQARAAKDSALRERIMEAMLALCGELGYQQTTVQNVIDRYGGHRVQFYQHFASKADCYASAYAAHSERLCERMLSACAGQPGWRAGLVAGLGELARYLTEAPLEANGLLAGAHLAGEPVRVQRQEMLERLTRAVDSARRETKSRHSPPPLTAPFIVSAIDAAATSALYKGRPQEFAETVMPELVWMAIGAYFGEEAAEEDRAKLR